MSCSAPLPKPGILCSVASSAFALLRSSSSEPIRSAKYDSSKSSDGGEGFSRACRQ